MRRRAGAGFLRRRRRRRRRTVPKGMTRAEWKLKVGGLDVWAAKKLGERNAAIIKTYKEKAEKLSPSQRGKGKRPPKHFTPEEIKNILYDFYHLRHGPTFFRWDHYQGEGYTPEVSQRFISDPLSSMVEGDPPNMSSLRIPEGWCVDLYDQPKWKGNRLRLCNQDVPSLAAYPLTVQLKTYDVDLEMEVSHQSETTWDNRVASVILTQYQFIKTAPPPCGEQHCGRHTSGTVECHRTGGAKPRAVVPLRHCVPAWPAGRNTTETRACPPCPTCANEDGTVATPRTCLCGGRQARCRAREYCDAAENTCWPKAVIYTHVDEVLRLKKKYCGRGKKKQFPLAGTPFCCPPVKDSGP